MNKRKRNKEYFSQILRMCDIIEVLDRRQAVRHWVLVPAFAGSNPAGPAIKVKRRHLGVFSCSLAIRRTSHEENTNLTPFNL